MLLLLMYYSHQQMQTIIIGILTAYLCGSIPFGKLLGYVKNIDIQKHGSGNIGFANAVRVLGWPLGILVLAGDVAKGFIPVLFAKYILKVDFGALQLVALAAIIGHIYPVWLRFRGGKGVATGLGTLLAINPLIALSGVAVYIVCFSIFKKSAISSVSAALSLPFFAILFDKQLLIFCIILALAGVYTHRINLKRYLHDRTHKT